MESSSPEEGAACVVTEPGEGQDNPGNRGVQRAPQAP